MLLRIAYCDDEIENGKKRKDIILCYCVLRIVMMRLRMVKR